MKIGIDISPIVYQTGVSWYTVNLVKALLKLDQENVYILFGGSLRRKGELDSFVKSLQPSTSVGRTTYLPPYLMHFLWNKLHVLPVETFTGNLKVFHSSDWTQPPTKAFKVTTIHDLSPIRYESVMDEKIVKVHRSRLTWVAREVDRIIAVSSFVKNEIVELLNINPEKIVVIPEAPDPQYQKPDKENIERTKRKFKLPEKYLLVVGTDPRKNVPTILKAFSKIRENIPELGLVIAGRKQGDLPEKENIFYLGHVSEEDKIALYSGAEALVYISTYEGFGLPILEAMQLGCPVITSNISSMPEVAGSAAQLVDPTDAQEVAIGIEKVLSGRKKWIEKGTERAQQFSWEDTAKLTLRVYRGEL